MGALILTLIALGLFWFYLCRRMFALLEVKHPQKFSRLGSPDLFLNDTPCNQFRFLVFILRGDWNTLNDAQVAALGRFMRWYFIGYLLLFSVMMFVSYMDDPTRIVR